jgi:hypothetical protein
VVLMVASMKPSEVVFCQRWPVFTLSSNLYIIWVMQYNCAAVVLQLCIIPIVLLHWIVCRSSRILICSFEKKKNLKICKIHIRIRAGLRRRNKKRERREIKTGGCRVSKVKCTITSLLQRTRKIPRERGMKRRTWNLKQREHVFLWVCRNKPSIFSFYCHFTTKVIYYYTI